MHLAQELQNLEIAPTAPPQEIDRTSRIEIHAKNLGKLGGKLKTLSDLHIAPPKILNLPLDKNDLFSRRLCVLKNLIELAQKRGFDKFDKRRWDEEIERIKEQLEALWRSIVEKDKVYGGACREHGFTNFKQESDIEREPKRKIRLALSFYESEQEAPSSVLAKESGDEYDRGLKPLSLLEWEFIEGFGDIKKLNAQELEAQINYLAEANEVIEGIIRDAKGIRDRNIEAIGIWEETYTQMTADDEQYQKLNQKAKERLKAIGPINDLHFEPHDLREIIFYDKELLIYLPTSLKDLINAYKCNVKVKKRLLKPLDTKYKQFEGRVKTLLPLFNAESISIARNSIYAQLQSIDQEISSYESFLEKFKKDLAIFLQKFSSSLVFAGESTEAIFSKEDLKNLKDSMRDFEANPLESLERELLELLELLKSLPSNECQEEREYFNKKFHELHIKIKHASENYNTTKKHAQELDGFMPFLKEEVLLRELLKEVKELHLSLERAREEDPELENERKKTGENLRFSGREEGAKNNLIKLAMSCKKLLSACEKLEKYKGDPGLNTNNAINQRYSAIADAVAQEIEKARKVKENYTSPANKVDEAKQAKKYICYYFTGGQSKDIDSSWATVAPKKPAKNLDQVSVEKTKKSVKR